MASLSIQATSFAKQTPIAKPQDCLRISAELSNYTYKSYHQARNYAAADMDCDMHRFFVCWGFVLCHFERQDMRSWYKIPYPVHRYSFLQT